MTPWPDYAGVARFEGGVSWLGAVRRVQFEDGSVRQATSGSQQRILDLTAILASDAERDQFTAWLTAHADDWIRLPAGAGGPESAARVARIVGGRAGLDLAAEVSDRRRWRVTARFESPEPWLLRSFWDPRLPVPGSDVVVRTSVRFSARVHQPPAGSGRPAITIAPTPRPPLPAPAVRSASWWAWIALFAAGGGQAMIDMRTSPDAGSDASLSEAALKPELLPDLALALRAGERRLAVRGIGGADTTEPYVWTPADSAALDAFVRAARVGEPVDAALVWAGAGSLADLTALEAVASGVPTPLRA